MEYVSILNTVNKVVYLLILFIFVRGADDLYWALFAVPISSFITGLLSVYFLRSRFRINLYFNTFSEVYKELKEGFSLFLYSIFTRLYHLDIYVIIVGWTSNPRFLGYFSIATKIILLATHIINPLSETINPELARRFKDHRDKYSALVKKAIVYLYGIATVVAILLFFTIEYVFVLLDKVPAMNSY